MAVLQLPASIKATHQTAGLAGYPAQDIFGTPGESVLSPVAGVITRISGRSPSAGAYRGAGGPFGWSVYITGADGRSYFLTHFGSLGVRAGQRVQRGQPIGSVGDYPGATPDHIHEGVHGGTTKTGLTVDPNSSTAKQAPLDPNKPPSFFGLDVPSPGDVVTAALNTFFGGFVDQLKKDAPGALLTVGLVALGAVLVFSGFNHLAGGAPVRAAKSIGKKAAVVPIPV